MEEKDTGERVMRTNSDRERDGVAAVEHSLRAFYWKAWVLN